MKTTEITLVRSDELKKLLDSYMKVFCNSGKEISESRFAWYYTWIDRENQKAGGGNIYPLIKVFKDDLKELKRC